MWGLYGCVAISSLPFRHMPTLRWDVFVFTCYYLVDPGVKCLVFTCATVLAGGVKVMRQSTKRLVESGVLQAQSAIGVQTQRQSGQQMLCT